MTIEERLCFIRAGYSAQDIAAFEAVENKPAAPADDPATDPAQADDLASDPAPPEDMPVWAKALKSSLDEVMKTMQADNRRFDDMGDEDSVEDAAENALAKYITRQVPVKSNNHGGKRK